VDADGTLRAERGSGGLVGAFETLGSQVPFQWVAAAMTPGDEIAAAIGVAVAGAPEGIELSYVQIPRSAYQGHYDVISSRFLWFLQHGLGHRTQLTPREIDEAWRCGYRPANLIFARAVASRARGPSPMILVQDYHLYLAPRWIRRQLPSAAILHFSHIPWPEAPAWSVVPGPIRREILRGMLGADILGFQDHPSAKRFLETCQSYLPGTRVNEHTLAVMRNGRCTAVRAYPISVDPERLHAAARSPEVQRRRAHLVDSRRETTIVRVDRLDPTKNIPNGFAAFGRLLERRPDLLGRVRFLAFLVPSRTDLPEYRQEYDDVLASAARVNSRYGKAGHQPIELYYENDRAQALAAMSLADVVLVNPLADGMNLVAKEAPLVSRNDAALVLSTRCGAWEELHGAALGVEPTDVDGTAAALETALAMPRAERAIRSAEMRRRIEAFTVVDWLESQRRDLRAVQTGRGEVELLPSA
jgi:trehalose 6-phosphate synthase